MQRWVWVAVTLAGCEGGVAPLPGADCATAGACRCPSSVDVPGFGLAGDGDVRWAGPAEVVSLDPLGLDFTRGGVEARLTGVTPRLPFTVGDRILAAVALEPSGAHLRISVLEPDQEPGELLLWAFAGDGGGGEARGIRAAADPMACGALWPNALSLEVAGERAVLPPGTTAEVGAYEAFNGASFGLERLQGWIVRTAPLSSPR